MASRLFEETVLPHLDAAFNYARWLTRNDSEAEDVVQDACLRAMRFFSSLREDNARAWLLTIVRNSWYSRISRRKEIAESTDGDHDRCERADDGLDPEERLLQQYTVARVRAQRDMECSAILGAVDVAAAEHALDPAAEILLPRQRVQQGHGRVDQQVLGVVERDAGRLQRIARISLGVRGEELPHVYVLAGGAMRRERFPGRRLRELGHGSLSLGPGF